MRNFLETRLGADPQTEPFFSRFEVSDFRQMVLLKPGLGNFFLVQEEPRPTIKSFVRTIIADTIDTMNDGQ